MTLFQKFHRIFPGNPEEEPARALYIAAVEQARRPEFYAQQGVPDSVDGRFELLVLHCFLVLRRLKAAHGDTEALAQTLFDTLIYDMDQSIRESGVGDLKVGPKLRDMAEAFYGRVKAYEAALESQDDAVVADAVRRNLYGTAGEIPDGAPEAVAAYLRRQDAELAGQKLDELRQGRVAFGPPPGA